MKPKDEQLLIAFGLGLIIGRWNGNKRTAAAAKPVEFVQGGLWNPYTQQYQQRNMVDRRTKVTKSLPPALEPVRKPATKPMTITRPAAKPIMPIRSILQMPVTKRTVLREGKYC